MNTLTDAFILKNNLDKLHTTELGILRIQRNLSLTVPDVIAYCKEKTMAAKRIERNGKNWYVYFEDAVLTVNAHSYTVITAHKTKISENRL